MARPRPEPEEIFLNDIKSLIKNLLINNPNYKNGYYWQGRGDLMTDTKERANYILDRIDQIDHLVKPFEEEEK